MLTAERLLAACEYVSGFEHGYIFPDHLVNMFLDCGKRENDHQLMDVLVCRASRALARAAENKYRLWYSKYAIIDTNL
jgi:hypothetical protein